jgi:hypothetical protein
LFPHDILGLGDWKTSPDPGLQKYPNTKCLVVRFVPIVKNDGVKVNGKDDIPYMKWKMKK